MISSGPEPDAGVTSAADASWGAGSVTDAGATGSGAGSGSTAAADEGGLGVGPDGLQLIAGARITQLPFGTGRDEVFVGRIREDTSHARGIAMWLVSDNLRKGAATNAVQIAESLVTRGWM